MNDWGWKGGNFKFNHDISHELISEHANEYVIITSIDGDDGPSI
jgi:hypothetical protein